MSRRRKNINRGLLFARIEGLDAKGRGIAEVGGRPTRIDGALPGEHVIARWAKRGRDWDAAVLTSVSRAAPPRILEHCAHARECGGCSLQHLCGEQQLQDKQAALLQAFAAQDLTPEEVAPPITASPWGYRSKARLGVKWVPKQGGLLVGFRQKLVSRVAVLERCEVLIPEVGGRIRALRELIGGLAVREALPQIELAAGDDQIVLILRHLQALTASDRAALIEFARDSGISIQLQPGGPDSVHTLWPQSPPPLSYALQAFDLRFEFSPLNFTQVNLAVNRQLVARAVAWLRPGAGQRVLDLFCGIGNFSLALARGAGAVLGVEGDAASVRRAGANAALNRVGNAEFLTADLFVPDPLRGLDLDDYVKWLLDPPRSGAEAVVRALGEHKPECIVYVSCSPETLARDAAILVKEKGYRLACAGIVDMFPHTRHVESIARFERVV